MPYPFRTIDVAVPILRANLENVVKEIEYIAGIVARWGPSDPEQIRREFTESLAPRPSGPPSSPVGDALREAVLRHLPEIVDAVRERIRIEAEAEARREAIIREANEAAARKVAQEAEDREMGALLAQQARLDAWKARKSSEAARPQATLGGGAPR